MRSRALATLLLLTATACTTTGAATTTTAAATTSTTTSTTTTTTTTTTTPPTTTTTTTTTTIPIPDAPLTWERLDYMEEVFAPGAWIGEIIDTGAGLLAVGSMAAEGWADIEADLDAAVWNSDNGETWIAATHDEGVFGGEHDQQMSGVTAGGTGFIAVGSDASGGDADAAVWLSAEGLWWQQTAHNEANLGGDGHQHMEAVVALPDGAGYVAVGSETPLTDDGELPAPIPAAWTSTDGWTWQRVTVEEQTLVSDHSATMVDAAVYDGLVVAVGHERADAAPYAAVWTSPDGVTWTRIPYDPIVFAGDGEYRMASVTAHDQGILAVGGRGGVWRSADGRIWERTTLDTGPEEYLESVATTDFGFVAVGTDWSLDDGVYNAVVWWSTDGDTWYPYPADKTAGFEGDTIQGMYLVAAGGPGLVAIGSYVALEGLAPVLWTGRPIP